MEPKTTIELTEEELYTLLKMCALYSQINPSTGRGTGVSRRVFDKGYNALATIVAESLVGEGKTYQKGDDLAMAIRDRIARGTGLK